MKKYRLLTSITFILLTVFPLIPTKSWGNALETEKKDNSLLTNPNFVIAHGEKENPLAIPDGQPIPKVTLIVHPDAKKGWNLELKVTNFKFSPENINVGSSFTEGHAHLYINGKKITRIYSNWYHLPSLDSGSNKVTVTLNTNDHRTLMYKGNIIEDTKLIDN